MEKARHIVIVPSPLYSHLVCSIELSKRILDVNPELHVTCIIPILDALPSAFIPNLHSLPPNLHAILLPPISKDHMPPSAKVVVKIQLTLTKSMPSIHDLLTNNTPFSALIADPFSFQVLNLAKKLNALSFIFLPSNAMMLSLLFHIPKLDQMLSSQFKHLSAQPIQIPGCLPLHGTDLPDPLQDPSNRAYKEYLQRAKSFYSVDGVLVNSFLELEQGPATALMNAQASGHPPVYLVGPLTLTTSNSNSDSHSITNQWLDKQPHRSVLYICFGAGGTLSQSQINELAFGLELSGKRFIWVLRVPSDSVDASLAASSKNVNPIQFLPQGFLERTKDHGLVIPSWAPQVPILAHPSTAAFLTNCGWNSILESVQHGVPMIAWPLFAEQKMNAAFLSRALKVALSPKANENGVVHREEICVVIKTLMETEQGKQIYKRMKPFKDDVVNALKHDGSSTIALFHVAQRCQNIH